MKRDLDSKDRSIDSLKKQHEREILSLKKQLEQGHDKKDGVVKVTEEYEKKIRQLKEEHDREMQMMKASSRSASGSDNKEILVLQDKIKKL